MIHEETGRNVKQKTVEGKRINNQYQINFLELLQPSSRTLLSLLLSCFAFVAFLN